MIVLCAVCGVRRVRNSKNSPPHTQIERECDRIEEVEARLYQEQMRSNLPNLEKRARERDDAILSAREEFETHTQAVRIEKQIDLRLKRSQDTFAQVRTIAHTAHTPHTHLSRFFMCVCVWHRAASGQAATGVGQPGGQHVGEEHRTHPRLSALCGASCALCRAHTMTTATSATPENK
jgi:hypothetical protein